MADIPSQRTWVALEAVTAAYMNRNIRDGINFHNLNRPLVVLNQDTPVSTFDNGVWTSLTFGVTTLDRDGGHSDPDTSKYICRTAGWYQCSGVVSFSPNASGVRFIRFINNGVPVVGSAGSSPAVTGFNTLVRSTKLFYCNVNDVVQVQGYQGSGGPLATANNSDQACALEMVWLSQ